MIENVSPIRNRQNRGFNEGLRQLCYAVLLFSTGSSLLLAQSNQIIFHHLTSEQRLSMNTVTCIAQDHKGFMWFGTDAGLNRFDGYSFKVFNPQPGQSDSLRDTRITALYVDRCGTLWVGTRNFGLHRYNPETESFYNYQNDSRNPESLSHNAITAIIEDQNGRLWIGTEGGGLNVFDQKKGCFARYLHDANQPDSLSDDVVYAIFQSQNGSVWIGTDKGLNRFDKGRFSHFLNEPGNTNSLAHDSIYAICETELGILWLGTDGGGLCRFDSMLGRFSTFRNQPGDTNSLSHDRIRSLYGDETGKIWIGTWGGGLNCFEPSSGQFSVYTNQPSDPTSISTNSIYALYEDSSGVLWVGTQSGGINTFPRERKNFKHYRHLPNNPNSLNDSNVYGIAETPDGIAWIGTFSGGLNRFDRKTGIFTAFKHDPANANSLPDNRIPSLYPGQNGLLWIGTTNGMSSFDYHNNKFNTYLHDPSNENSLSHNRTFTIYQDHDGYIWIGTRGGLDRLEPKSKTFTHYRHDANDPESLSHNSVYSICEDRSRVLWVGTEDGLNRFDRQTGKFRVYRYDFNNPASIIANGIYDVYESRSGDFWIATTGGLNRMDRATNTFTAYTVNEGLPDNVIYGLLEDSQGNLWLSTNNGISRFDPQTRRFRNFSTVDGLQNSEFNGGGFFKNSKGEMYFGGINGFNVFTPEEILDNPFVPPVVITDFKIMNKSVPVGVRGFGGKVILKKPIADTDEIVLSYRDRLLSFEFAALHYLYPEKNLYASKMEGFETDWNYTDARRRFRDYSALPPGRYTFRVKGSNSDQVWNEQGVALKILINPPFWQVWWFRALLTIFIASLILFIFRLRVRQMKKREKELEQLVEERTRQLHEASLTDPLTGLRNRRFISEILQNDASAFMKFKDFLIESQNKRTSRSDKEVFGLFLLDMDHFKQVNDTYGHEAGDLVLKQFAKILKSSVRLDDVVIRLGGEEFLVVLKKTLPDYIHTFADKLLAKVVSTPFDLGDGHTLHKTCSIGYTCFPVYQEHPTHLSLEQSIMVADIAMYYAKNHGRNQAVFLEEGPHLPIGEELVRKTTTSLEFALKECYLKIS